MKTLFVAPTVAHLLELAAHLRPADAEELRLTTGGLRPLDALVQSCECSDALFAGTHDGRLLGVFGIRADSVIRRTAVVWMLGTREIDRRPRPFIRDSPAALLRLAAACPEAATLHNTVWTGNAAALRWLAWLGASFSMPFTDPANGQAFINFSIDRSDIPCATAR